MGRMGIGKLGMYWGYFNKEKNQNVYKSRFGRLK
jgi:hypothetical protein